MFNNTQRGANMADSILRLPAAKARTGLSRSTIYALVARGEFPKQISLSSRAVGWMASEVDAWLQARIAQSRKAA
jgi:prophage regulatory protein